MSNHVHIIWQPLFGFTPSIIQASFMKHTSKQLKASLENTDKAALESCKVNKYERIYQLWKREPLSVELRTAAVFAQKLDYIHYNPVAAGLCAAPEAYYYSPARFYRDGIDDLNMLVAAGRRPGGGVGDREMFYI